MWEKLREIHIRQGLVMSRFFPWWLGFMFLCLVAAVIFIDDVPWWILPIAAVWLGIMFFLSQLGRRRFEEKARDLGI